MINSIYDGAVISSLPADPQDIIKYLLGAKLTQNQIEKAKLKNINSLTVPELVDLKHPNTLQTLSHSADYDGEIQFFKTVLEYRKSEGVSVVNKVLIAQSVTVYNSKGLRVSSFKNAPFGRFEDSTIKLYEPGKLLSLSTFHYKINKELSDVLNGV